MIMDNNGVIAQELNTSVARDEPPGREYLRHGAQRPQLAHPGHAGLVCQLHPPPEHLYEGVEDWKTCAAATTNPIGTGAYKFVSYDRGVSVVLEKNPDYHMGEPDVERLIFQVIPDSDTALQAFFNGEVDMLKGVPSSQVPALLQDPQYKLGLLQRRAPLPDRRQYAE